MTTSPRLTTLPLTALFLASFAVSATAQPRPFTAVDMLDIVRISGGVSVSPAGDRLAFVLPENFPNAVLPAAYTVTLQQIAKQTQGARFETLIGAGGAKHSHWRVLGIGLVCLIGVFVAIFLAVLVLPAEFFPEIEGAA